MAEIVKMIGIRKAALPEKEFLDWINSHVNKNEQSALHVAVQHGHVEAAIKLTELGSSLDLKDINGRSAVLYAARYGRMDLLKFFGERLAQQSPFSESDSQGDSALHLASIHGHIECVRFLVASGADVNAPNKFGETPLHKAARTDNLPLVELLLELGADANAMGRDGKPRHVAASEATARRLRASTPGAGSASGSAVPAASPQYMVDVDKLLDEEEREEKNDNDEDDDDDDVVFLVPGVRKIIEGVHGASPDSELVHFKLRRAMQKSPHTMLGGVEHLSDEQLFKQHEVIRKKSIASGSLELAPSDKGDAGELALPREEAGVQIEMTLASGMAPKPAPVNYLFEPYRGIFGKPHFNYVSRTFNTGGGAETVVATVLASTEGAGGYPGLLRWSNGYSAFALQNDDVKATERDDHKVFVFGLFFKL